jgi:translocation and assembly module TamB
MLEDGSLACRARLDRLEIGRSAVELRNDGPIVIDVDRGELRFARAELTGPASRLTVTGTASLVRGLALGIDGEVDLGLLATLTPRIEAASGSVGVHADVRGPALAPTVFGQAVVADAGFRFAGLPEPIEGLEGTVELDERSIVLDGFVARFAGGTLRLGGDASLSGLGLERYDLSIELDGAHLAPEDGVSVATSASARLSWDPSRRVPLLHGTVRLSRVSFTRDIALAQDLQDLSRRDRVDVEEYDPEADRFELDLRVVDDGPMRVANNLRIGVIGTLEIARGTVRFRNTDFDVRRGLVRFDDSTRIDPRFDVLATTELRRSTGLTGPTWRISLHAHGTRDSFRLDTSSDPELAQEDVALLLALGMTRAELEQLQAGDLTSTAVLETLTTVTGAEGLIREALPVVDEVHLRTRYSPRTGRTEPEVTVGRRLSDRVRVTASTGLGEAREVRTGLEWQLDDHTSVEAAYDNLDTTASSPVGNIGVDLRWRLEFE